VSHRCPACILIFGGTTALGFIAATSLHIPTRSVLVTVVTLLVFNPSEGEIESHWGLTCPSLVISAVGACFHACICHLFVFFREVPIPIPGLLLNWVFCFAYCVSWESLCILDMDPQVFANTVSHSAPSFFTLLWCPLMHM
jgi:hypothetical protein